MAEESHSQSRKRRIYPRKQAFSLPLFPEPTSFESLFSEYPSSELTFSETDHFVPSSYQYSYSLEYPFAEPLKTLDYSFINIESPQSTESIENFLNRERLHKFKEFTINFLELIKEHGFEYGMDSPAEIFVRECIQENELATREWLNDIFIQNYDNVSVLTGILRVISHFDYNEISPEGITMALAAIPHANVQVRECGIRALENWGTIECLKILKNIHYPENWLQSYVDQVVKDLEEIWGADVASGQKD